MIESHPGYDGKYSYWVSRSVSYAILAKKQTAQSSGNVLCEVRSEDENNFSVSRIYYSITPADGSTPTDEIKLGFV